MSSNRRQLLRNGALAAGALLLPVPALRAQALRFSSDPFLLGVASGYPTASSLVLWTRLAPEPLAPDWGMPPVPVRVEWQVAADERFNRIVASGETEALPELAHSVHIEVEGLLPARDYWYRFISGSAEAPVGRARTAPLDSAANSSLRIGLACCQHYESGHYAAYAAMADDDLDLIIHVGDYIYENAGSSRVREHSFPVAQTLADYRQRHALYKLDESLKRAHASAPWLATWDDHEVDNDYAGAFPALGVDQQAFLARRTAAYQAYYENLPLPPSMRPRASGLPLHTRQTYGQLAEIFVLDGRQFRSRHACGQRLVDPCPELFEPDRTMLGRDQERWLGQSLSARQSQWTLFAQQTVFAAMDQRPGPDIGYWSDSWSGYPAARQRLVDSLDQHEVRNAVILSGDIHAWLVNDIHRLPGDPASAVVATEIVGTSISSPGPPQAQLNAWQAENPNVHFANSEQRGYTRLTVTPERLDVDLIAVDDPALPDSGSSVRSTWRVVDGKPGAVS